MLSESFNQERIYKEDVQPLVEELARKCEEHGLPFTLYLIYAVEEEEDGHTVSAQMCLQGATARMTPQMLAAHSLIHGESPMHRMATSLLLSVAPEIKQTG